MSQFNDETAVNRIDAYVWATRLECDWSIDGRPNGGYVQVPILRALAHDCQRPHPLTITTHFLRPSQGDCEAEIRTELIRSGRTLSTIRGTLSQGGRDRALVLAAFGELDTAVGIGPELQPKMPAIPPPDECLSRNEDDQGVVIPLLSRVDCRLNPTCAQPGKSAEAVIEGWIRFRDGAEPSILALPLFADAFPPSPFPLIKEIGWVPTIELTVHVRRAPAPGWVLGRFECNDLSNGRFIESGNLWDSNGEMVAQCRQIGLLLGRNS